jgi:anaphase-promoting complex subunit 1
MVMAMRYAGTADPDAFKVIYRYAKQFFKVLCKPAISAALPNAELVHRGTVMNCVGVLALSLGVLMAGSGDLATFRFCRVIHLKTGEGTEIPTFSGCNEQL